MAMPLIPSPALKSDIQLHAELHVYWRARLWVGLYGEPLQFFGRNSRKATNDATLTALWAIFGRGVNEVIFRPSSQSCGGGFLHFIYIHNILNLP